MYETCKIGPDLTTLNTYKVAIYNLINLQVGDFWNSFCINVIIGLNWPIFISLLPNMEKDKTKKKVKNIENES